MNEFCNSCPDKRGEECQLPSRIRLVSRVLVDVVAGMGAAMGGSVSSLDSIGPDPDRTELKYPRVVKCIEEHEQSAMDV